MKLSIAILTLLLAPVLRASEPSTNLLSIYLVDTKLFHEWPSSLTGKGDDLKLISPPVLADSDFVAFDVTNCSFVVTPNAAKRLAQSIWDLGRKDAPGWGDSPDISPDGRYELIPAPAPFVIKASGETVYVGAFWTLSSSSSFGGPVLTARVLFISSGLTNNVTFYIGRGSPGRFGGPPDFRLDNRIVSAAKKLFTPKEKKTED